MDAPENDVSAPSQRNPIEAMVDALKEQMPVHYQTVLNEVAAAKEDYDIWKAEAVRRRKQLATAKRLRGHALKSWTFCKKVQRRMLRRLKKRPTYLGRITVCRDALDRIMEGPDPSIRNQRQLELPGPAPQP